MKELRFIFVIPFITIINIIVYTKLYIRHKRNNDVNIQNFYSVMVEITRPLLEKYDNHAIPFSATFWLFLFVFIK